MAFIDARYQLIGLNAAVIIWPTLSCISWVLYYFSGFLTVWPGQSGAVHSSRLFLPFIPCGGIRSLAASAKTFKYVFRIAALYAYALYTESSKISQYFICLILFALSLMAKSCWSPCFVYCFLIIGAGTLAKGTKNEGGRVMLIPLKKRYSRR